MIKFKYLLLVKQKLNFWLNKTIDEIVYWNNLNLPIGKKYFLIGTPEHSNIGDSAIVVAEKNFISHCFTNGFIKEITFNEYPKYNKLIANFLSLHSQFFWHGGGNMGDQWFNEEAFRRKYILNQLVSNPIIFPQTIYYSSTKEGMKKQEESIEIYNHSNIRMVAREQKSYEIMRNLYPDANVILTPDIVLSSTMNDYGVISQKRENVLWVMRSDEERSMTDEIRLQLIKEVEKTGLTIMKTDMYSDCNVNRQNRLECVRKKMQEFCSAKLVITDRLHGMVFAAITGTPCIVFSNYNHKVKGTYDWISYLPYIKYVENIEDAIQAIPELLEMKDCHFDNTPLLPYFEKLKDFIKEK